MELVVDGYADHYCLSNKVRISLSRKKYHFNTLGIALYHNGAVKDAMKIFNSTLMESTDNKSPDILALCYTGQAVFTDIVEILTRITTNHWKVTEAVIMMRAK